MSDQTKVFAPLTEIRISTEAMQVPQGFRLGAASVQPDGTYYYVIRNTDGKSCLCRRTPSKSEVLSQRKMAQALHAVLGDPRGGQRKGAGRPTEGKVKMTVHVLPSTRAALGDKPGESIDALFRKS